MPPSDSLNAANAAIQRGLVALSAGNTGEAKAAFEESFDHAPDNHIALQHLSAIAAQSGIFGEAERLLKRVLPKDITPQALLNLAKIQTVLGKADAALTALMRALEIADVADPICIEINTHLAAVHNMLGNRDEATRLYHDLVASNPNDKNAALAYAKLVWTESPAEAIGMLERTLKRTDVLAERRDILKELILYREIESRRGNGLAPYHIDDLSHIHVRHALMELNDLTQTCLSLLDSDASDQISRTIYAQALHAVGDYESSQAQFHALTSSPKNDKAAAVHYSDDYTDTAARARLTAVAGELPSIDHRQEQAFYDSSVIVVSSDYRYFVHFTKPLLMSLERHMQDANVHIHIMDAPDESLESAIETCAELNSVRCAISSEQTGLASTDIKVSAPYYHAIRFVRFAQLRARYDGPLWMMDADALANRNPTDLLEKGDDWDVALRVRPGRLEPWNVVSAGLVGMANTAEAAEFYSYVAAYIAQGWQQGKLPWGIDQMALYSALLRFRPQRLRLLTPLEFDADVQPDGVFWFLSGRHKALFPSLRDKADQILPKLNERERRYAASYRQYIA